MKITLTINIDVPGAETWTDQELRQNLFDDYVSRVQEAHLEVKGWLTSGDLEPAKASIDHCNQWIDIAQRAAWTFVREI